MNARGATEESQAARVHRSMKLRMSLRLFARVAFELERDARAARFIKVRLRAFPEATLRDAQSRRAVWPTSSPVQGRGQAPRQGRQFVDEAQLVRQRIVAQQPAAGQLDMALSIVNRYGASGWQGDDIMGWLDTCLTSLGNLCRITVDEPSHSSTSRVFPTGCAGHSTSWRGRRPSR